MGVYDRILAGMPALTDRRPDVPPALEEGLRRALAKDPGLRSDVAELATSIGEFASARGKLSVERVCRLVEQGEKTGPLPVPSSVAPIPDQSGRLETSVEHSVLGHSPDGGGGTAGPWERHKSATPRKRVLLVVLGLGGVAAAVGLVVLASSSGGPSATP